MITTQQPISKFSTCVTTHQEHHSVSTVNMMYV